MADNTDTSNPVEGRLTDAANPQTLESCAPTEECAGNGGRPNIQFSLSRRQVVLWVLALFATVIALVFIFSGLAGRVVKKDDRSVVQYLGIQPDSARVKIVTTIPMEVSVKDSVWWSVPFDFQKKGSYIVTVTGNAYQRAAWTNGLALRNKADELVSPAGAPWTVDEIPEHRRKLYPVQGKASPAMLIGAVGELTYRDSDGFPIIQDAKYFPIGVKRTFRIAGGQQLHLGMNEPLDWSVKTDNGGIWKFQITVQRE